MALNAEEYGPNAVRRNRCLCCPGGSHVPIDIPLMLAEENRAAPVLENYPCAGKDYILDSDMAGKHLGMSNYSVLGTHELPSGRTVVYLLAHWESDRRVQTPLGLKRTFDYSAEVWGYEAESIEKKSWLGGLIKTAKRMKKIEVIPRNEQQKVRMELSSKLIGATNVMFKY